jgi:hypothetical protein
MAVPQLTKQIPTDTRRGGPSYYPAASYIKGVHKLFKALPSSGKVIAIPNAKASYFPLNQNDTILACAVTKLSLAIPNNILPINIV